MINALKLTTTSPIPERFSFFLSNWIQLSAEERGMAGAPQGNIYQVKVLASHEFTASRNLRQDLKVRSISHPV